MTGPRQLICLLEKNSMRQMRILYLICPGTRFTTTRPSYDRDANTQGSEALHATPASHTAAPWSPCLKHHCRGCLHWCHLSCMCRLMLYCADAQMMAGQWQTGGATSHTLCCCETQNDDPEHAQAPAGQQGALTVHAFLMVVKGFGDGVLAAGGAAALGLSGACHQPGRVHEVDQRVRGAGQRELAVAGAELCLPYPVTVGACLCQRLGIGSLPAISHRTCAQGRLQACCCHAAVMTGRCIALVSGPAGICVI